MTVPKIGKELATLTSTASDTLFGNGNDMFYEDMAVMRKLADQIITGLPTLSRKEGMAQASEGWALVTVEPTEGYPSFDLPPIPGLFGVPHAGE